MKKVALLFLIAVFAPTLVLAWMAMRSVRDQDALFERQQAMLFQGVAGTGAREVNRQVEAFLQEFKRVAAAWAQRPDPKAEASDFDSHVRSSWELAAVGFAVSLNGEVLSPQMLSSAAARRFRVQNDRFLCSQESVQVYWNSPQGAVNLSVLDREEFPLKVPFTFTNESGFGFTLTGPQGPSEPLKVSRKEVLDASRAGGTAPSRLNPADAQFRNLIQNASEGTIARFVDDRLSLLFWHRPMADLVLGAEVNQTRLIDRLKTLIRVDGPLGSQVGMALLNDNGVPVAKSNPALEASWRHPAASVEVGEVLPHWSVAVYALNPESQSRTRNSLQITLGLLIAMLVISTGIGGGLIVADVQRQVRLAKQKTDFVSHVSHELKTPLTSIRMFAELLMEDRANDPEKRARFLGIITAETARLTRLINNVLDFAHLERKEQRLHLQPADLGEITRRTVGAYRPRLEAAGFEFVLNAGSGGLPIQADPDSIAQVLLNLLSNAEKYSTEGRSVRVEIQDAGSVVEARVLDRGPGVPDGMKERIFEQFVRGDDSLSNGVQGTGLGLTLARQIARAHGGDVTYRPREGGGSCFSLTLPKRSDSPLNLN